LVGSIVLDIGLAFEFGIILFDFGLLDQVVFDLLGYLVVLGNVGIFNGED
jgi:hypothetical protein